MSNTDRDWELWGKNDPYYGVFTDPAFRKENLTTDAKKAFFQRGDDDVAHVFSRLKSIYGCDVKPQRAIDFGSGVGRLTIPLARRCAHVTGIEVSESMIKEAVKNTEQHGLDNVNYIQSDDTLSRLTGTYDFINSFVVMQHIPVDRGVHIFQRLIESLEPGGYGAIQMTYANYWYYDRIGLPPLPTRRQRLNQYWMKFKAALGFRPARHQNFNERDPEMMMYNYVLNQPLYILQRAGIMRVSVDFTDHGGAWGVYLFFQKT